MSSSSVRFRGGWIMFGRRRSTARPAAFFTGVALLACSTSWAVSSQEGGTGLVRVDRAHSLPITGLLISSYGGYFSNDLTPGSRLFTFQPSITKGLGGGFEISGTLPLEGLTSDLADSLAYSRRFELRGRDPIANVRWTGPIGTSRFRAGAQGSVAYGFGDETRPGGTADPKDAFDIGVKGLLSMEFGSYDFPMQLHVNGGYWWSRNDGAFYYREMPTPLPIVADRKNDVFGAGVALQGGLQRVTLFAELTTEHFLDARGEIAGSENLWRLTPGVRSKLSSSIAATAALSFDLSKDNDRTAFDPDDVYPDVEFRLGLALGQVLRRLPDLPSWRAETEAETQVAAVVEPGPAPSVPAAPAAAPPKGQAVQPAPTSAKPAAAPAPPAAEVDRAEPAERREEEVVAAEAKAPKQRKVAVLPPKPGPQPLPMQPAPASPAFEQQVQMMQQRLEQLEMVMLLDRFEERLARLERMTGPVAAAPAPVAVAKPGTKPAAKPAAETEPPAAKPEGETPAPVVQPKSDVPEPAAQDAAPAPAAGAKPAATEPVSGAAAEDDTAARLDAIQAQLASLMQTTQPGPKAAPSPTAAAPDTAAAKPAVEPAAAPASKAKDRKATESKPEAAATTQAATPAPTTREQELAARVAQLEREIGAARAQTPPAARDRSTTVVVPATAGTTSAPGGATIVTAPQAAAPAAASTRALQEEVASELARSRAARAQTATIQVEAPAPVADTSEAIDIARVATDAFPLAVGEKTELTGIAFAGGDTAIAASERDVLDTWAKRLASSPRVRVMLLVHGTGADRSEVLARSDRRAKALRQHLVAQGAQSDQVVAIGMGLVETETPTAGTARGSAGRVELQRVR